MQSGTPRAGSWGIQRYSDSATNLYEDGSFISQNTAMWGGFTTSDIIGIALDCDNGKIYFSKNGVFKDRNGNTGDPANGTNGFFILKDGNSVTDQSGNGNNWTVGGGTLTNTEDCPSNVFATLNPLDKGYTGAMNTSDGNTTMDSATGSGDYGMRSTLAANSGKYYWETKLPNYGGAIGGVDGQDGVRS